MKNKIDLSKIPSRKTPTKWITANLDGEERKFEIRALNDGEKMNLLTLLSNSGDVFRTRNMYVALLASGLEIQQEAALAIFDGNSKEAMRVGDEIFEFSKVFDELKASEAEDAEKNSVATPSETP